MAEINLKNDETIKVDLASESPINTKVNDLNYIPGYKIAEEQRRLNEAERITNENERETYYEDFQSKVDSGYFKGQKGDKGEKGDIGLSNTLVIGTVIKGEEAEATITGTAPNQTLNLVLPKGDQGEQGIQGIQGSQGIQGERGLQGEKGDKGDKGEQGLQGIQGLKGDKGDKGEPGTTDYNELTNKPTIPTKTSDLTNDSDFTTNAYVDNAISTAIGIALGGEY